MIVDTRLEKYTLVFALGLPCFASLWLMIFAPGRVSPTTYAVVITLLVGTGIVALNTWKSAQATGSVGQLIYETNTGRRPEAARSWGLVVSLLVLSAVTTGVIVTTWLS